MTITKRIEKGTPLTWQELDANFDYLDENKADKVSGATDDDIAGLDGDGDLKSLGPFSDLIQLGLPTWEAAISYDDGNYNEVEYAKGDIVYKQDITHTGSELTSVTYYKSTDGGSNFTEIGTETLNYTNGELTSTTWADA